MVLSLGLVEPVLAACPPDSVASGTACIDKYEASVWFVPAGERNLVSIIQKGTVTLADLTSPKAIAAGVVQLGLTSGDLAANGCPVTGNGCVNVYAVSVAGVAPAAFITWFQSAAAARNSLKRLPTNQEWQVAALGTPDTGGADDGLTTCNTDNLVPGAGQTGSRSSCRSDVGAFDMVGSLDELVADWVPRSNACGNWGAFSDDFQCLAGADTFGLPGVLTRGGMWLNGASAGVFAVGGGINPSESNATLGFRCAR
jgi:hypothetical protein